MTFRLLSALLWASVGWGCDPWSNQDAQAPEPGYTQKMQNVPYCRDGRRDRGCLFGTNCRVTEEGCQVCQCEGL